MALKAISNDTPEFDLPIFSMGPFNGENPARHPLEWMYFIARPTPKLGKPYILAGVVTATLKEGEQTYLMVDTVRVGGDYDGEKASQCIWIRDFSGSAFSLFKNREEWLSAIQRRMKK